MEASKLARRRNPDLALVYENAKKKGNANLATLAVARKGVAYLLAVDRGQRDFVPIRDISSKDSASNSVLQVSTSTGTDGEVQLFTYPERNTLGWIRGGRVS